MTQITNRHDRPVHFVVGKDKSGEPAVQVLRPGESANVDVPHDSPNVLAFENARMIEVKRTAKAAAAVEAAQSEG